MSDIWEGENKESRAKELANDLLALQIDLILKPEIMGGRMPSPRIALCEIAEKYVGKLKEWDIINEKETKAFFYRKRQTIAGLKSVLDSLNTQEKKNLIKRIIKEDRGSISGGRDAYQFIYRKINAHIEKTDEKEWASSEDDITKSHKRELRMALLKRMHSNSIEIVDILDSCDPKFNENRLAKDDTIRQNPIDCNDGLTVSLIRVLSNKRENGKKRAPLKPLRLTRKQYSRIQKIWEIGLQEIVMQTIVQIDGDVTTRVLPRYASSDHHFLYQIHRESVSVSMHYWRDLVKVLATFFASIWKLIFPKKIGIKLS